MKTIELHRPRALNALNLNMVRSIMKQVDSVLVGGRGGGGVGGQCNTQHSSCWRAQLDVWEEEAKAGAAHTAVVTKGTGEKAFCGTMA